MARDPNLVPLADDVTGADTAEGVAPGTLWTTPLWSGQASIRRLLNQLGKTAASFRDAYLTTGVARSSEPGIAIPISTLPASGGLVFAWLAAAGLGGSPGGYTVRFHRDGDSPGVDSFQLQRWDAGAATFLSGVSVTLQAGGWIALVADAGGVEGFYSQNGSTWTSIGSSNDQTYTGTLNGAVETNDATVRINLVNFGAQTTPDTTPPGQVTGLEVTESQITPAQITAHFFMPADADTFAHSIRYKMGLAQTFLDETDGLQFFPVTEAPASAEVFADNPNFNPEDQVTVAVFARDSSGNWNTGATDDITLAPAPSLATYTSNAVSTTTYGVQLSAEQMGGYTSVGLSSATYGVELSQQEPPPPFDPFPGAVNMLMNIVVEAQVTPYRVLVQTSAGLQVALPNDVIVTTASGDRMILLRADFESLAPDAVFDPASNTYGDTTAPGIVTGLAVTESPAGTIVANFTMPTGVLNRDVDRYLVRRKAGLAQTFADETDGVEFTPETAAAPGAAVQTSLAGFASLSTHTLGVFAGDGSGNWSAAVTDDITMA